MVAVLMYKKGKLGRDVIDAYKIMHREQFFVTSENTETQLNSHRFEIETRKLLLAIRCNLLLLVNRS